MARPDLVLVAEGSPRAAETAMGFAFDEETAVAVRAAPPDVGRHD